MEGGADLGAATSSSARSPAAPNATRARRGGESGRTCRTSSTAITPRCSAISANPCRRDQSRLHHLQRPLLRDGRVLTWPAPHRRGDAPCRRYQGHETLIPAPRSTRRKLQSTSIMPEGLPALLGPDRLKDLLAFLMEPGLEPAPIRREEAPPARTKAEVEKVLKASTPPASPAEPARPVKPLRIVLVDGPKDHGLDEHDYPAWKKRWKRSSARPRT